MLDATAGGIDNALHLDSLSCGHKLATRLIAFAKLHSNVQPSNRTVQRTCHFETSRFAHHTPLSGLFTPRGSFAAPQKNRRFYWVVICVTLGLPVAIPWGVGVFANHLRGFSFWS